MIPLLAQVWAGWSIGHFAIAIILVIAVVAIVVAFAKYSGVPIPPIVVTIFWIILGAAVCIAAIRFLMGM